MSYIYKIINDINNKIYIGKTNRSIEERFKEHCKASERERHEKRPLYSAMNKYGVEHFKIEEIEQCDLNIVEEREKYWIEYYGSFKYGYNATLGGDGKAYIDRDLVIKTYNETQNQVKVAEILNIDRKTVHNILKENDIQIKKSQDIAKENLSKSVAMLDKNTLEVIRTFSSIKDAEKFLNISYRSHIAKVCNGKRQTFKGYKWKWI